MISLLRSSEFRQTRNILDSEAPCRSAPSHSIRRQRGRIGSVSKGCSQVGKSPDILWIYLDDDSIFLKITNFDSIHKSVIDILIHIEQIMTI